MNAPRLASLVAALALVVSGCGFLGQRMPTADPDTGVAIAAVAGPTCAVEQLGQPCPPRPVAGATVDILDEENATVSSVVTDAEGLAFAPVPPGDYVVRPHPVDGLMGTAQPLDVTVVAGSGTPVTLEYDTGIR